MTTSNGDKKTRLIIIVTIITIKIAQKAQNKKNLKKPLKTPSRRTQMYFKIAVQKPDWYFKRAITHQKAK